MVEVSAMKSLDEMTKEAIQRFDQQVADLFANDPKMNARKAAYTLNCTYGIAYKACLRLGLTLRQGRR